MPAQETQSTYVKTDNTNWNSIQISDSVFAIDYPSGTGRGPQRSTRAYATAKRQLFEHSQQTAASLPERFPRLTILTIALVFFAAVLMAEYDYLRSAGYHWPW